jgi:hypothetical protein
MRHLKSKMNKFMIISFKKMLNHIFKIAESHYKLINLIWGRNMIFIKKISSKAC